MTLAEAEAELTAPGQLFEMDDLDIRGVPTRVWKPAPPSLRTVLDLSLAHGDKDFLVYEDERTTFDEHYRIVATLAHRLRDELGVEKGDRVAIAMRNLPEWVVAFWAVAVAGAVAVPLNAWWTGDELAYGLADSGAVVAVVDEERADRIRAATGDLGGLDRRPADDDRRQRAPRPAACRPDRRSAGPRDRVRRHPRRRRARRRPAGRRHPPRRRRDDLLHLGDDRPAERRRRDAPQRVHEPDEPVLRRTPAASSGTASPLCTDVSGTTQSGFLLSVPLFHATGCHADHRHQHRGRRQARAWCTTSIPSAPSS